MAFGADRFDLPLYGQVEHPAVKEDNGVQRLSLGRCGNMKMSRQMAKERIDFLFPHLAGMGVATMELDVSNDPVAIALLGTLDNFALHQEVL